MLCSFTILHAQQSSETSPYVLGEILIKIDNPTYLAEVVDQMQIINSKFTGLRVSKEVSRPVNIWLLSFDENAISHDDMITALYSNKHILVAQNNHYIQERVTTPNDPNFSSQWHHIDGSDNDIDSDLAWDVTTGGTTVNGDEIVVCVIEGTGADWDHPDLLANHWVNEGEIDGNGVDDDGNGYIDDYHGWNSGANNDNISNGDHGTSVSGMIGAVGNNSFQVSGINWDVKIMQVDMGSLTESNVIAAYTYPLVMRQMYNASGGTEGAFVVATNASWGIDNGNPASYPLWCDFYNTLGENGILNCGATANNDVNIDAVGDLPTACSSPYMISVTATNSSDVRTFSGYGQTTIDLGAPGDQVITSKNTNSYGSATGTSFASPLTAGVIALLYAVPCQDLADLALSDPEAAANIVRDALLDGVDPVANLTTETVTGGRLNAFNSVQLIQGGCGVPICDMDLASATIETTCHNTCDGEIVITPTGGSGTFTYDIGDGPQTSNTFTGLCDGDYTIIVDDGDLCNQSIDVVVDGPAGMSGGTSLTHELMGNDGAINLSVGGGTPPYTFEWTGPGSFSANTEDISGLTGGTYSVVVTDANGCVFTLSNINISSSVGIGENENGYSLYPNPASKEFIIELPANTSGTLVIYDAVGKIVLSQNVNQKTVVSVSDMSKGAYIYTLTNSDGEIFTGKLVVE